MATEHEFAGENMVNHSTNVRHQGYKSKNFIVFDFLEIEFKHGMQLTKQVSIMQNKYKLEYNTLWILKRDNQSQSLVFSEG